MRRRLLWRSEFAVLAVTCVVASSPVPGVHAAARPAKVWAGFGMVDAPRADSAEARRPIPPPADVAGRWMGTWTGVDSDMVRSGTAIVELAQDGGTGWGKLVLYDTNACDVVPRVLRQAGGAGVPVVFGVLGSRVLVTHELGAGLLMLDLEVRGAHLIGRFHDTSAAVRVVFTRVDSQPRASAEAPALTR